MPSRWPPFDAAWSRIEKSAGKKFHLKEKGSVFVYELRDGCVIVKGREGAIIPRSQFERAHAKGPARRVLDYGDGGPSYVWAILHDERITLGED